MRRRFREVERKIDRTRETKDTKDTKNSEAFKSIKPETDITMEECQRFFDSLFADDFA